MKKLFLITSLLQTYIFSQEIVPAVKTISRTILNLQRFSLKPLAPVFTKTSCFVETSQDTSTGKPNITVRHNSKSKVGFRVMNGLQKRSGIRALTIRVPDKDQINSSENVKLCKECKDIDKCPTFHKAMQVSKGYQNLYVTGGVTPRITDLMRNVIAWTPTVATGAMVCIAAVNIPNMDFYERSDAIIGLLMSTFFSYAWLETVRIGTAERSAEELKRAILTEKYDLNQICCKTQQVIEKCNKTL